SAGLSRPNTVGLCTCTRGRRREKRPAASWVQALIRGAALPFSAARSYQRRLTAARSNVSAAGPSPGTQATQGQPRAWAAADSRSATTAAPPTRCDTRISWRRGRGRAGALMRTTDGAPGSLPPLRGPIRAGVVHHVDQVLREHRRP